MNGFINFKTFGSLVLASCGINVFSAQQRPNIIVILVDDLGQSDLGFMGCKDILTPNIDKLAQGGVICTDAYVTAPYSGPSRCGLMTGRYQQRFGAEGNTEKYSASVAELQGVPTDELMLSELLKNNGYRTCAIGKWHMGDHHSLLPNQRGFDYFYGFSGGGHNYWGISEEGKSYMQENGLKVKPDENTYLTDDFSKKAVEYIDKNSDSPFFMYLAYNAPHAPLQAPKRYLDRTKHIYNEKRSVYAAMVLAVDDGVGMVCDALKRNKIDDNTLIFFLSDNGGYGDDVVAMSFPLRARKGNMFEGGIKVPFVINWNGVIKPDSKYSKTVSSLDIFATSAAVAGVKTDGLKNKIDGVNIIPYLKNNEVVPNRKLFWRVCGGLEYAVRKGDYKLVKTFYQDEYMLFDLKTDPYEIHDIAIDNPGIVESMAKDFDEWNAGMMRPRWVDLHEKHQRDDRAEWESFRKRVSRNR